MPFCPKCKYEYKDGIKICSDCNIELVDSLDVVTVTIMTRDENTVDEALDFLTKNEFTGAYKIESEVATGMYDLLVPESKYKEAVGMLNVYYKEVHEATEEEKEMEEQQKEVKISAPRYIDSSDRAENYKSGASVLIGVGLVGIFALILINLGVINLPVPSSTKTLINIVMGVLFVGFIAIGFNSFFAYKKIKVLADSEDDLEAKITKWAENELDIESLKINDSDSDSEEIKFFNRTEALRTQLDNSFPELDPSFKEHIIEDLYDGIFGCE